MLRATTIAATLFALSAPALCGDVTVTLTGTVSSNSYSSGPFGGAMSGDTAILSFEVFATPPIPPMQFTNYAIDLATFDLDINGSTGAALGGPTNLVIQNDAPAADGFRIFQTQLATNHFFTCEFGTGGGFFSSGDITMLAGTYDAAANLTSFGYTIQGQGGFMEIFPETLEIGGGFDSFCIGDGGDQMGCTACPCTNEAPIGSTGGCMNSAGGSATLVASGSGSLAAQDLCFNMTAGTPDSFGVLTSGDNRAPANAANPCFGLDSGINALQLDGLRCVVQGVLRHGSRALDSNGDVGLTNNGWGDCSPNFPNSAFMNGQTRHFQAIYRENPGQVCATEQNSTQGVTVTFSM